MCCVSVASVQRRAYLFRVLIQLHVAVFLYICIHVYLDAYVLKKAVFLWLLCDCMSVVSVCIHEAACLWLCVSVVPVCTQEAVCNVCFGGCVSAVLCVSPC